MKATITDVHNSHGLVFTLNLEKSDTLDDNAIDFFSKNLESLISGVGCNRSTLYINKIKLTPKGCSLTFVEQSKVLAMVEHRWNSDREDNKYTVLIIEVEPEKVPAG
mgnify:CR=1 FL=1